MGPGTEIVGVNSTKSTDNKEPLLLSFLLLLRHFKFDKDIVFCCKIFFPAEQSKSKTNVGPQKNMSKLKSVGLHVKHFHPCMS